MAQFDSEYALYASGNHKDINFGFLYLLNNYCILNLGSKFNFSPNVDLIGKLMFRYRKMWAEAGFKLKEDGLHYSSYLGVMLDDKSKYFAKEVSLNMNFKDEKSWDIEGGFYTRHFRKGFRFGLFGCRDSSESYGFKGIARDRFYEAGMALNYDKVGQVKNFAATLNCNKPVTFKNGTKLALGFGYLIHADKPNTVGLMLNFQE